jgi:hypothetical protein
MQKSEFSRHYHNHFSQILPAEKERLFFIHQNRGRRREMLLTFPIVIAFSWWVFPGSWVLSGFGANFGPFMATNNLPENNSPHLMARLSLTFPPFACLILVDVK